MARRPAASRTGRSQAPTAGPGRSHPSSGSCRPRLGQRGRPARRRVPRPSGPTWRRRLHRRLLDHAAGRPPPPAGPSRWELREKTNSGLISFFFFVVGLEHAASSTSVTCGNAPPSALPLAAGLVGMLVPALVFLAINAGQPTAGAWGVAMSTDTAFALERLACGAPRRSWFLLTALVVDDVVALAVIATVYSTDVDLRSLMVALVLFLVPLTLRRFRVRYGLGAAPHLAGTALLRDPPDRHRPRHGSAHVRGHPPPPRRWSGSGSSASSRHRSSPVPQGRACWCRCR